MADNPTDDRDAKLIAMGAQLDAAWRHELSLTDSPYFDSDILPFEVADHAVEASSVIVAEIRKQRATTLAGLKVKARALAHEFRTYYESVEQIASGKSDRHHFDPEEIMAASLVLDVLAMDADGDAPLPRPCARVLAEYEASCRAAAA
jgi:bifunctional pyridoxal-dependent enzyme with beta-cystathionase and maltose regulon repressor activities